MKNIYVTTLYNLKTSGLVGEFDVYELYKQAFKISLKNIHKHNKFFFDEYIVLINNNDAKNNGEMDYHIILKLYEIWSKGNVNVFYSEIDTICHGSLEKVLNFNNFMMFSKGSAPDPDEYNSGVLYFPCTMDKTVWDYILKMHSTWDMRWAYFQKIFDSAFKSQKIEIKEHSEFNSFKGELNPLITHHFSSRGIHNLIHVYKQYDIDEELPLYKEL
jgi:hypothetical protein